MAFRKALKTGAVQFDLFPEHAAFYREVMDFVAANWPGDDQAVTPASHQKWQAALLERGWSVPDWPEAEGGPGWDATQRFIWHHTCAAYGVERALLEDPGVAVVGPLLLAAGHTAAKQIFLPPIRNLAQRWCIGVAEPEHLLDVSNLSTLLHPTAEGYALTGCKIWVAQGSSATWMCCLAKLANEPTSAYLVAVELVDPAVKISPQTTLDGASDLAMVTLEQVNIRPEQILAGPGDAQQYAQALGVSAAATLTRSAIAQAQLQRLETTLLELTDEPNLQAQRHAVAIELAGLQALELRYVDAQQRGVEPPVPLDLLRLKGRDVLLQIGALQVQCFGYYALPYPDEVLLHNEGPIGPQAAVAAMRNTLAQQVASLYEGTDEALRDNLARRLKLS